MSLYLREATAVIAVAQCTLGCCCRIAPSALLECLTVSAVLLIALSLT